MFSEVRAYIISFRLSLTNNPSSAFFNEHVIIVSQRMNEQIVVITRASCSFLLRWRNEKQVRSEEHTCELQSLMRSSYAVSCLKKKNNDSMNNLPPKILLIEHYTQHKK